MSKQHTLYWILAVLALVVLWAARRAIVKSGELRQRTHQREEEFLTQFPEYSAGADAQRRRGT